MNLKKALELLDLIDSDISIKILKKRYRELQKKYHPDKSKLEDTEIIKKINEAYKILIEYLESYEIKSEEILEKDNIEEKLRKRFSNDWLGGKEI